ncbi:PAS domain-containing sensor histidine kinase [Halostella pelagica]|uniref:PAS domain-containing sensor histidine kinase n=1 Tax=Halostella pelagica TaxID=2583824 RepID=UPI001080DB55
MGSPGSTPDITQGDVRDIFVRMSPPSTPITAAETAEKLECSRQTARQILAELAETDELETKQIAGETRVWWLSESPGSVSRQSELEEFGAFVSAVREYAIYMLDSDGVVVDWNEGAERIKGYDEDEIVGEHVSTFYTDADIDDGVPEENIEAAAANGRVETEGWRVRKDGSRFWANDVITAIRDDDGSLQGYTKVTRDLTEQREYEQRLRQERDLTEQILETVPVSICSVTSNGEFVRGNQRMLDRIGVEESEIENSSFESWDIYDADGELIPSDELPWTRVLETGEPVFEYECQIDYPGAGRRWLSLNAAPITDGRYEGERVVVSVDDVTDRKEREQRLRREYDQTEQLLRTAPSAIAVQNTDRETVIANRRAQEAFGLSEQEFTEDPVDTGEWEIYGEDGEQLAPNETLSARVLATGEPVFNEEIIVEPPDGERKHFRANAAPLFGSDETIQRIVIAGEDITELKKREKQLEQRKTALETELSEVFGRITDAFYALDDDWQFTHVNDQAEEWLDFRDQGLVGKHIWEVFDWVDNTRLRDEYERAMETQEPTSFEFHYPEPLDAWYEINAYPSETGLSVYFRDVTERKDRQQELRRKERRYEAIFQDPNILVGLLEPDGTVLDINQTAMEYVDATLDDVTGQAFWETPWWGEGDGIQHKVREWTERAATGEYVEFEADLTRPDGEQYTLNGVFRPVTNESGDVVSLIVSDRDITERKRRERQLEESERRYRTLIEYFPNGAVTLVNDSLRYQTVGGNPDDVTGVTVEEIEGKPVREALPPKLADELAPRYEAALDGESGSFETGLGDRVYQFQVVPIRDDDGDVFAALGMSQNITERREYERKLEESNERLEQFAYAASHDLQEPLRMVTSYLQLLENRYADELDGDAREFIGFAVDGAERMREMIDGLLKYSRVETKGDPFESVELEEVLSDVRDDLQIQIEESDAEITGGSLPRVEGDPGQLRQVFQNLLENAIEYSGDGPPRVHVDAERDGSKWRLSVSDEGIGIDPDDEERIFEVFQRLHSRKEHAGTGIGLALCKRIVERHDGDIWVDTERSEGTAFSFTLPAAEEPAR